VARSPQIAIVGAGNLAVALATALRNAGYRISEIVFRQGGTSGKRAGMIANRAGGRAVALSKARFDADLVWLCVPDRAIAECAEQLANSRRDWKGKIVFHSSGALPANELARLKKAGAAVAAVHPLMTFVRRSQPGLAGVPFAVEGDPKAVKIASGIVRKVGGMPFSIVAGKKPLYHAWGAFLSPLIISLLVLGERVGEDAGIPRKSVRAKAMPILRQTLDNYAKYGAADAFSGPLVRGDVETVRRHLDVLRNAPHAKETYIALAQAALQFLPVKDSGKIKKLIHAAVAGK
jgi:predicted short-subunit dehydrogenase-like oxidoreductase (DUF2520 family)